MSKLKGIFLQICVAFLGNINFRKITIDKHKTKKFGASEYFDLELENLKTLVSLNVGAVLHNVTLGKGINYRVASIVSR